MKHCRNGFWFEWLHKMKTLAGMTTWSNQLLQLGFLKEKETDGSERYRLFLGECTTSFWTQIHVIPIDECWQVTYSRSEVQVGLWKMYNVVRKIDVNVHFSPIKMIEEIFSEKHKKPGFFRRFWFHESVGNIHCRVLVWPVGLSSMTVLEFSQYCSDRFFLMSYNWLLISTRLRHWIVMLQAF